ncbi:TIR domain-containing protein [Sphingomonas sp.]|uniref:TIR domain-containing protein n=1 Tax=Sphingomonas sp. TaxID=28214 RepID=UPI00286E9256|nr:TIR domain-containing protein [Sphingomonas sp.]
MSDIFISYARSTEPQARVIADALKAHGYEVWRDDELPAHRAYGDVIEERLKAAKVVVVLWSADAAKSQWVRSEADAARGAGTLVQATLDGTVPPLPFNQIQCADLCGWGGEPDSSGWRKVAASVAALAGQRTPDAEAAEAAQPAPRTKVSVCVLPFTNMSGDPEQEYFSDGISEDILTDLSKVSALSVLARNTAFACKGCAIDVPTLARKLNVSHVLEGSVRKAGGRVRITAQLIDGAAGDHVWAERYDRELTDIFAIQDEISQAIVAALKVKLLPAEKKAIEQRGTACPEAYNYYLLARKYWITGNWGNTAQLELVIRICRRAVELDPDYASAWGLMALVQCIMHFTFAAGDDDGTAAADRALAIDPDIAEAYCVRARHFYEQGRYNEADEGFAQALRIDPDSWEVNRERARIFYFQRRFADAARHYEKAVSVDDSDYHSWSMLCSVYRALGNQPAEMHAAQMALAAAERALAHDPTNGSALATGVTGLAALQLRERAGEWIERALLISPDNMWMRYNFACVMALQFADAEAALDLLEPLFPRFTASAYKAVEADPDLDPIRDQPRFKAMMEQAAARLGGEGGAG